MDTLFLDESLRQRRDDILALAHFYVQRFAAETKKPFTGLAPDVQDRFLAYSWPGNVRELANVIERAVVLGAGPQITLQDLPSSLVGAPPLLASLAPPTMSYHDATVAFQRALLRQALAQAEGNHTAAAQALGLQRTYFQRLLRALDLR